MTVIEVLRAGPQCTVQDRGRRGQLIHGISASGPMDRAAFERAGAWLGNPAPSGIEFTAAPFTLRVSEGNLAISADGGGFRAALDGDPMPYPLRLLARAGQVLDLLPGDWGNYGYLRFGADMELAPVLGSVSTNLVAGIGGLEGRALAPGDRIRFGPAIGGGRAAHPTPAPRPVAAPVRVIWGLHADLFLPVVRRAFVETAWRVSRAIDRMGARLEGGGPVFEPPQLSLVSDAVVAGDIQVLGDGTPIVLLRDHQPTGGYPRIATVVGADLDRLVQLRPGEAIRFDPVTVGRAQALLRPAGAR